MRSVDYNNRDLFAFEVKDIYEEFVKDETVEYVKGDIDIVSKLCFSFVSINKYDSSLIQLHLFLPEQYIFILSYLLIYSLSYYYYFLVKIEISKKFCAQ